MAPPTVAMGRLHGSWPKEQPTADERILDVLKDGARAHGHPAPLAVDLVHRVHPAQLNDDRPLDGHCATHDARATAARHEGDAPLRGVGGYGGYLFHMGGRHKRRWQHFNPACALKGAVRRQRVPGNPGELVGVDGYALRRQQAGQVRDE